MKRFSFIVFWYATFSIQAQAQKVNFSLVYKPNTVYTQTTQEAIRFKFGGPETEILEALSDALTEQSLEGPVSTKTEIITRSGDHVVGKNLPLVMIVTKSENSISYDVLPVGTTIYGHVDKQRLAFDSIKGHGANIETGKEAFEMVKGIVAKIEIPDTTLKVGDSISVTSTVPLPMPDYEIKMDVITQYKLVRLDGSNAHFDILINYSYNSQEHKEVQMTGSGKGVLLYDVVEHFYKEFTTDSETNIRMKMGEQEMKITTNITLNQSTTISH